MAVLIFQRLTATAAAAASSLHWTFRDGRPGGWGGAAHPWHECPHLIDVKFSAKKSNANTVGGSRGSDMEESSGEPGWAAVLWQMGS